MRIPNGDLVKGGDFSSAQPQFYCVIQDLFSVRHLVKGNFSYVNAIRERALRTNARASEITKTRPNVKNVKLKQQK